MSAPIAPFNPAAVPITFTLNFHQVNTILTGLGKLPYEEVENLYNTIRSVGINAMNDAETQHKLAQQQAAQQESEHLPLERAPIEAPEAEEKQA